MRFTTIFVEMLLENVAETSGVVVPPINPGKMGALKAPAIWRAIQVLLEFVRERLRANLN